MEGEPFMDPTLESLYNAILTGKREEAVAGTEAALEADLPATDILHDGLISAMDKVGELFEANEYFVPEMLISARAMQSALGVLRPHLVEADVQSRGKMVVGTVQGDLHDIGKNLVAMMVEGAGFDIIDLGTDVSPEEFVEAIKDSKADFVGLSALLTTTLTMMSKTIQAISEAGLRDKVKIIIGGAPATPDLAEEIGADGYAPDAGTAASLVKRMAA
jgi:5-methyltetrahydrofolate--homocysteine methyltransferase